MRLLVSAGGTGGHIIPALSVIAELGNIDTALEVLWIGTEGEMEEALVPREGYRLVTVSGGGIHGVGIGASLKNMTKLYQGWRDVFQAQPLQLFHQVLQ
ncbi:MAG: glycosyltransferase, partial [Chloroflexota bacterium]